MTATPQTFPSAPAPKPRHPGGRPPKFKEPSKLVTITLPCRIIDLLSSVDSDRARAIVKLADFFLAATPDATKPIEFLTLPDGKKLILVADSQTLRTIPWLHLVELSPARHLLCLDPGHSVEKLELTLVDILETAPDTPDRALLSDLLHCLRTPRRSQSLNKGEIIFIEA